MTCPTDADTKLIDLSRWDPPVETEAALSRGASEGQLCFVKDEDRTYVCRDGHWQPVADHRTRASA